MHHAPTRKEAGFTLVEMLVAIAIFALIAVAGVGILRSSVDSQSAVERRLADLGQFSRLQTLLASDLGQAVARTTRGPSGFRPEFGGDATRMEFVRAGWTNPEGAPRSDLQRVEWRRDQGELVRIGHAQLDGGDAGQKAAFARDVEAAEFRYRNADGDWSSSYQSSPDRRLPAAVELTLTRRGEAPVTFVLALTAAGPVARPGQPQSPGAQ